MRISVFDPQGQDGAVYDDVADFAVDDYEKDLILTSKKIKDWDDDEEVKASLIVYLRGSFWGAFEASPDE